MNYIEFSAKIKEKYPEYKDVDDLTLAQKIVEKYPEYKEKVNFEEVKKEPVKKGGIDLTPSGLVKGGLASVLAPIRGAMYGEDYKTARENALANTEKFKPAGGAGDFIVDMAVYSKLPMLRAAGGANKAAQVANVAKNSKGLIGAVEGLGDLTIKATSKIPSSFGVGGDGKVANIARFLGNAAIQGGIPGAVESLKRDGNVAGGAGLGTGIAAALQGITPQAGKVINKVLESNFVNKNLPKVLEGLTSVPADYSQRALEKELAGKSILNGKFDADTAYIPIEQKLRKAKDMLPTAEDFAEEYNKLGQKAVEGLENLKTGAGQEISNMLSKLSDSPVDIGNLKNALNSTIKSYAKGGNINPAEIRAGRELEQVKDLLGLKDEAQTAKALSDYLNANKFSNSGSNTQLNKETENVAFDILAQVTGKNKRWLQSQLNANMPKMSTQKRQEFIENLLENTDDKIEAGTIDPVWLQHFPELAQSGDTLNGADIAQKIFNRILSRDFKRSQQLLSPSEQAVGEMERQYDKLLGEIANKPTEKNINDSYNKLQDILSYTPDSIKDDLVTKYANDIESIENIVNPKAKPIDLHNIKELLYDVANYDTAGGIKNDVIKGVANQINNYLRRIEPNYAKPNDIFSLIKSVEKDAGGLNPNTIGGKIANIGSKGNITSGLDNRLKNIDNLLPDGSKFYKQAQDINAERDAIDNIQRMIGQQYERNPRLLANRTDEGFENAINNLQKRTGVNFMDELNDIRAREALEKFFPGQGGGSGSSQGFGNLLRTSIIGGSPAYALLGHNPFAWAGLLSVSPKFTAKGTIKNIGKLSNAAKKATSGAYDEVLRKLSNLGGKAAANMLYGGVEYNNYQ